MLKKFEKTFISFRLIVGATARSELRTVNELSMRSHEQSKRHFDASQSTFLGVFNALCCTQKTRPGKKNKNKKKKDGISMLPIN